MHHFTTIVPYLWLLTAVPLAKCVVYNVVVGGPGVLRYDPEFVNAELGDVVRFTFQQKNHTVTQSSFQNPCQRLADGFDTGFIPVADSVTSGFPVAELTVTNESPVWAYCRQGNHCQQGMVFAINPGDKFAAFKAAATGVSPPSSVPPSSSTTTGAPTPANTTTAPASSGSAPAVTVTTTVATTQSQSTTSSQAPSATTTSVDHRIVVGGPGLLTFQPANIKANIGDTITFEFRQKNHTATASSFNQPCQALSSTSTTGEVGFDSGFMPVADTATTFPTFVVQVNDTKPIWAFCRQGNHCAQGMVFAANAVDNGPNNFDAFLARAKQTNGTAPSTTGSGNGNNNNGAMARGAGIAMWGSVAVALVMGVML